jgi:hypothetical protein
MPGDSGSEQARDNKIIPSATFHYRTLDALRDTAKELP